MVLNTKFLIFFLFFLINISYSQEKGETMSKIGIVPLGDVPKKVLEELKNQLTLTFGKETILLKKLPLPTYAYSKKRNQYYSSLILDKLKVIKNNKYERILGITDADLYVPNLNFVFGEADILEGVCIISVFRLREEFYKLPPDENLFLERVKKEAIHELGHTYGLIHCPYSRCVMHFSNSISDTDAKLPNFCPKCFRKLQRVLGVTNGTSQTQ
jgi:archaemetzincin